MDFKLYLPGLSTASPHKLDAFSEAARLLGRVEGEFVHLDETAITTLRVKFPDLARFLPPPPPVALGPRKFSIAYLKATAAQRPPGFVEFVLDHAKIENEHAILDKTLHTELLRKFPKQGRPFFKLHPGRLHLSYLDEVAKSQPPGFLNYTLAKGTMEGNFVNLNEAAVRAIQGKFPLAGPPPVPPEPTVAEMAANFTLAMSSWVKAGFKIVKREVYESRHALCLACEYWDAQARGGLGKCNKCGCTRAKLWIVGSKCPDQPPRW